MRRRVETGTHPWLLIGRRPGQDPFVLDTAPTLAAAEALATRYRLELEDLESLTIETEGGGNSVDQTERIAMMKDRHEQLQQAQANGHPEPEGKRDSFIARSQKLREVLRRLGQQATYAEWAGQCEREGLGRPHNSSFSRARAALFGLKGRVKRAAAPAETPRPEKPAAMPAAADPLADLLALKALADRLGGLGRLRALVDGLEQLCGGAG